MCSIWAKETIRASRGRRVARQTPPVRKIMFGSISVVSRRHLIAAAAATALLCLAAVPAEAGCSKSVIMYNASWCPYCAQVRAILARNHIRYAVLRRDDPASPSDHAETVRRHCRPAHPYWRRACRGRRRGADQAALPLGLRLTTPRPRCLPRRGAGTPLAAGEAWFPA